MQLVHLARQINGRSISPAFRGGRGGSGHKSRLSVAGGNYRNPAMLHSRIIEWGGKRGIAGHSMLVGATATAAPRHEC